MWCGTAEREYVVKRGWGKGGRVREIVVTECDRDDISIVESYNSLLIRIDPR